MDLFYFHCREIPQTIKGARQTTVKRPLILVTHKKQNIKGLYVQAELESFNCVLRLFASSISAVSNVE